MSALARREFIINGSAALAALAVFQSRVRLGLSQPGGRDRRRLARSASGKSRFRR